MRTDTFVLLSLLLTAGLGPAALAQQAHRVSGLDDASLASLDRASETGDRLRVESVPLFDGPPVVLDLERFDVLAPGARVHVWDGKTTEVREPRHFTYWRGRVEDEADSSAFLMVGAAGEVRGFVSSDERFFLIGSQESAGVVRKVLRQVQDNPESEQSFRCGNEDSHLALTVADLFPGAELQQESTGMATRSSLPTYAVDVAVETDFEYYQIFQNLAAAEDYIYTLFGGIATVYDRDVDSQLRVSDLWLYTTSNESPCNFYGCKWVDALINGQSQTVLNCSPSYLLDELRTCWNSTPSRQGVSRNLVHLVSGKDSRPPEADYGGFGGGVAYVGVLGGSGWSCNNARSYAYGVTASIDGNYDPNTSSMYWDFSAVAHEVGHNFNSPHTHCYNVVTPGDEVDQCRSGEQTYYNGAYRSCYSGSQTYPSDGGSIMSYCHLLAGQQIIKPWFGRAGYYGTQSERVPARMSAHVMGADLAGCLPEPVTINGIFDDGFETGNTNAWSEELIE